MISRIIKKIMDLVIAVLALILMSPLFMAMGILIKLTSVGPVFFKQDRVGLNGKVFKIYKFRTMVVNAEKMGLGLGVKKDDERITKIGKVMREWTLDELPQLINILKGDMSLVGPRPLPVSLVKLMDNEQKKRQDVLPGLVSLVDIKGRALVEWEGRFKLDKWYIDNWSLFLDLKILILGFFAVLSKKGVYGEGGINKPLSKKLVVTIHQPEYLPYIGFFQRLAEADFFVALDDAAYQKNGFINRNKIKTADGWQWLTVPVKNRSSNLRINEVLIDSQKDWQSQHLKALETNYSKAPFFRQYFPFFQETFSKKWDKIIDLDIYLIENICRLLGIEISIKKSSGLRVQGKATDRLINMCKEFGIEAYLSGPGSREHRIEAEKFEEKGIEVRIKEFISPEYKQLFLNKEFVSNMSIIDLLFNEGENSINIIKSQK